MENFLSFQCKNILGKVMDKEIISFPLLCINSKITLLS